MRQRLFIGAFEDSVDIVGRNRYSQDLKIPKQNYRLKKSNCR